MYAAQQIERAPRVQTLSDHNEDDDFCRRERLDAQWQLCPRYVALESGGNLVFLDGCGRPIFRAFFVDERVEILKPDAEYRAIRDLRRLHNDFGVTPGNKAARDRVRSLIEKYKIAPELRDRWQRQQRGELAGGRGW